MSARGARLRRCRCCLQSLVPPTAIKVFKTSAWPEPADCMGQAALKGYLGRKSHVAQLNAAGKHMAALHGWEVRSSHPPSLCWACTALRPHWALQAQTRPWHTMHALHVCCESSWPLCEAEFVLLDGAQALPRWYAWPLG